MNSNIRVERLWRSVKYEEVYLKEYESVSDLIADEPVELSLVKKEIG